MGSDLVVAYVRDVPGFSRAALREVIVDLWRGRGAKVLPARWSRAAADRCWHEDDALLGYALSPTSERGWIAVIESACASVRMDKELLSLLGARTTCWLQWACDHSNLHGTQRISKGRTQHPLDFGGEPYADLKGQKGWEFLAFSGASWNQHRDFTITERTKTHAPPEDAVERSDQAFSAAIWELRVDDALTALAELPRIDDHILEIVFRTLYRAEFKDVANCVLRVGSALAERCALAPRGRGSMGAAHWVRLLETAAICNDEAVKQQAIAGLAKAPRAKAAIAEALARFDTAAAVTRSPHDGRAEMVPAGKRFRRWTAGL